MLTEDQKKDLEDKNNMLINVLNLKDEKDLNVANAMLLKGFGYRKKDLENGSVEKVFGKNDDFLYRCEIGKLIDLYIDTSINCNYGNSYILDLAKKLSDKQLKNCAENIKSRLTFAMNMIESDEKEEISQDLRNIVKNQLNKCNEILN